MSKKIFEFNPNYTITKSIINNILKIEQLKEQIKTLPVTPHLMASLRESAKLTTTHYSTQIEGNRLTQEEVIAVIKNKKTIPQRQRDEKEIKGYYNALEYVEKLAQKNTFITEAEIKKIHSLVESDSKQTTYRDGQNVITDSLTGEIVYMPPEAKDVQLLMNDFVNWLNFDVDTPVLIRAAIAHYQYVTIHPYYDGNGRSARLLTTLILHKNGYDLKGIYSLEEYYVKNLKGYYEAITIGPSHNYYMGRAEADITKWIEYFILGIKESFENVYNKAKVESGAKDLTPVLRELDIKQRKILDLFEKQKTITSNDVTLFFNFSPRTARKLLQDWTEDGFLIIADASKKSRKYQLNSNLEKKLYK
jgi:Fic family protein